ncbi:sensor histidine kinase [Saccharopolyspora sp. MS10]|uniref:sensor histidine kinase n=1 Tax=Saccharopolyspora sp. MS10 TaxID=3385973 RepID=UPI0039A13F5E
MSWKNLPTALRGEAERLREDVRAAPRRTVIGESCCFLLLLLAGALTMRVALLEPPPWPLTALIALFSAALVPARRRWPGGALVAGALLAPSVVISTAIASVVVAFSAGRAMRPRRLWSAVLIALVLRLALHALSEPDAAPREVLLGAGADAVVLLLLPVLAGALLGMRQPLVRLLRERNDYLEQARHLTAEQARSAERASIAGEMHDMLGHRLSLLSLHAGALELSAAQEAPRVGERAAFLRTTAGEAMSELREILGVLRAGDPREVPDEGGGGRADVERLVADSRAAGMSVALSWEEPGSGGPDLDDADARSRHAVHRIVREGLTNAHKHAPGSAVEVRVRGGERIAVRVRNGPGSGPRRPAPGLRSGLAGLEERTRMLGGELAGEAGSDGGFALTAELPAHPALTAPRAEPLREPPPVLDADVLTLPRALGAGCLLLVLGLLLLVLAAALVAVLVRGW